MLPLFRLAEADTDGTVALDQDIFLLWSSAVRLVQDGDVRWSRPAATVPWLLGTNTRIYLGVLTGLPADLHEVLHTVLTDHGWYLGMMTSPGSSPPSGSPSPPSRPAGRCQAGSNGSPH